LVPRAGISSPPSAPRFVWLRERLNAETPRAQRPRRNRDGSERIAAALWARRAQRFGTRIERIERITSRGARDLRPTSPDEPSFGDRRPGCVSCFPERQSPKDSRRLRRGILTVLGSIRANSYHPCPTLLEPAPLRGVRDAHGATLRLLRALCSSALSS